MANSISLGSDESRPHLDSYLTNLSGDVTRLQNPAPIDSIKIKGFNNSTSSVTLVGSNTDGKREYFVPSMPPNLVLLCAQQYSSDGASILLPTKALCYSFPPQISNSWEISPKNTIFRSIWQWKTTPMRYFWTLHQPQKKLFQVQQQNISIPKLTFLTHKNEFWLLYSLDSHSTIYTHSQNTIPF